MKDIGLYIHVPFCDAKCPYCDFYSARGTDELYDKYTSCIIERINSYSDKNHPRANTLYFGGGTPSLLGGERIAAIIQTARQVFGLPDAEITAEANPGKDLTPFLHAFRAAGGNRLSIGLQSANEEELALLGRRHTAEQAAEAVRAAHKEGLDNLSLDLMLGIQEQTADSLRRSVDFCAELGVQHISAYLLKIEPHTVYASRRDSLRLPSEDETCSLYEFACEQLEKAGFIQYEISNFAKPGYESRHNLKYWHCEEYLGLGPSAHSYYKGKRFYYKRDLSSFMAGAVPEPDGAGGGFEEYAMLALRLTEGLQKEDCQKRFGKPIPQSCYQAARRYEKAGLTACNEAGIRLTQKGFLVSNSLLAEILYNL